MQFLRHSRQMIACVCPYEVSGMPMDVSYGIVHKKRKVINENSVCREGRRGTGKKQR